jgi:hypothetical protein
VSSMVSRAGHRRTSYDDYQNRLATRPQLIAAGGALGPEPARTTSADKFRDALSVLGLGHGSLWRLKAATPRLKPKAANSRYVATATQARADR